jgi:hypothetical protein
MFGYQKCIDVDICISLNEQCETFGGEIKIPLKQCVSEKYNLQHLCKHHLEIENNKIKPHDR